ncbi:homeobox protein vent1-like [Thalassophryne amazonica]|uniref:homeobox protein vent1-like n=1 Tax=Thalassophryne amazonica TaxID=390379 RepID=UPI0014709C25|nr:homeobox protein vent1-like [Thalassophryne amazonica]
MAQSSQREGDQAASATCGTNSESLPGFYCRHTLEAAPEHGHSSQGLQGSNHVQDKQVLLVTTFCLFPATEVGFSSGTEEETSGYESEGGPFSSPAAPADWTSSSPASPPSGRPRTAFTAEQIGVLETAFKRNAYLGTQDKAELCKKLSLSDKQIRNWFQNRRMKLKRTVQDTLAHACQANVAFPFMHYPEVQPYRPGPYSRYYSAPDGSTAASFVHPHSLQYASPLPTVPPLATDPFYQYNQYSSVPGVTLPSAMGTYHGSPHYY